MNFPFYLSRGSFRLFNNYICLIIADVRSHREGSNNSAKDNVDSEKRKKEIFYWDFKTKKIM